MLNVLYFIFKVQKKKIKYIVNITNIFKILKSILEKKIKLTLLSNGVGGDC